MDTDLKKWEHILVNDSTAAVNTFGFSLNQHPTGSRGAAVVYRCYINTNNHFIKITEIINYLFETINCKKDYVLTHFVGHLILSLALPC